MAEALPDDSATYPGRRDGTLETDTAGLAAIFGQLEALLLRITPQVHSFASALSNENTALAQPEQRHDFQTALSM